MSEPFIKHDKTLSELTLRAVFIGAFLSVVVAGSNSYLGLYAGMTISASIPAAVISMALLSVLGKSNVLENNIVQTAASAGGSLAAGSIFTLPALVVMGTWKGFPYIEATVLILLGGILGVLFTIPLRRSLIVEEPLQFPEGIATAEVLKSSYEGARGAGLILGGSILGALFKLGSIGLHVWNSSFETIKRIYNYPLYIGSDLSPALVSVGFIVGLNIAILVFIGGALNWMVAIPFIMISEGLLEMENDLLSKASYIWSSRTRYIGVGAMIVGGVWAIVSMRKSIIKGILSGLEVYKRKKVGHVVIRTEQDIPIKIVGIAVLIVLIPLYIVVFNYLSKPFISLLVTLIMALAAFLFSAVAGYMAGLVGSSNNPISGVTIATILFSSLLFLFIMGDNPLAPAIAIFIGAVVCCAAGIAGDNMQDLKAGYLLGATPWKQQIAQMVGVVAAALFIAPILGLIHNAYGIGVVTEKHQDPLPAPQATLMASVVEGVFGNNLPLDMVFIGAAIAICVILLDNYLKKKRSSFRTPVLAVAVGIYLPMELATPILIGGLTSYMVSKQNQGSQDRGILFGAGIISGEAIMGLLLAIPIIITGKKDFLAIVERPIDYLGLLLMIGVVASIFYVSKEITRNNTDKSGSDLQ